MAEAVFRSLTSNLPSSPSSPHPSISTIDSAGTGGYHVMAPPDPRTLSTLASHSITDYIHGARQVTASDFDNFDYILAMDRQNLRNLMALRERTQKQREAAGGSSLAEEKGQVRLFGEFGGKSSDQGGSGEEVVDPYYGADNGFETVFQQVERFSNAFLKEVAQEKP